MTAELDQAVGRAWQVLAAKIGVPVNGGVTRVSSRQNAKGQWRVVARVGDQGQFVLKLWLPIQRELALNSFKALQMADVAFGGQPDMGAPKPIAWDADVGAVLMGECTGCTLRDTVLNEGTDAMAARLEAVLGWLAALHAGSFSQGQVLEGHKIVANLERQARSRDLPDQRVFLSCISALKELAQVAAGQASPSAVIHGDLTMANVLIDGTQVNGIDFANVNTVFAAKDLAALFCDVMIQFGQEAMVAPFSLLPDDLAMTATRAYPHVSVHSDHFRFFAGVRLLREWLKMPHSEKERSFRREHVWIGTRIAAERLLLGSG